MATEEHTHLIAHEHVLSEDHEHERRWEGDEAIEARREASLKAAEITFGRPSLGGIAVGALTLMAALSILASGAEAGLDALGRPTLLTGGEVSLWEGIGMGLALFLSAMIGGWVAGRIGRYSGAANGALAVVAFVFFVLLLGASVAWVLQSTGVRLEASRLPDGATVSRTQIGIGAFVALVILLVGGILGGVLGTRFHRRADTFIADVAASA